jgi:hypothetical protein
MSEDNHNHLNEDTTEEITALNGLNFSVRKQGQNFTSLEEMQQAQQLFLAYLAETGLLVKSCRLAHISFPTYQAWIANDEDFIEACKAALEDHKERIYHEVDRRGRQGILEPLVRNGKVVTNKGKPIVMRKYSDRLLELLFNRYYPQSNMPQNRFGFTEAQNGSDTYVHLPWNELSEEEQAIIEQIGLAIEYRQRKQAIY